MQIMSLHHGVFLPKWSESSCGLILNRTGLSVIFAMKRLPPTHVVIVGRDGKMGEEHDRKI